MLFVRYYPIQKLKQENEKHKNQKILLFIIKIFVIEENLQMNYVHHAHAVALLLNVICRCFFFPFLMNNFILE